MNSRSSGLTTVKTTRALSLAAPSRMGLAESLVRMRVCKRMMAPEWGNCSIAARTTFSAVSPVESLRISMRRVSNPGSSGTSSTVRASRSMWIEDRTGCTRA